MDNIAQHNADTLKRHQEQQAELSWQRSPLYYLSQRKRRLQQEVEGMELAYRAGRMSDEFYQQRLKSYQQMIAQLDYQALQHKYKTDFNRQPMGENPYYQKYQGGGF